MPRINKVGHVVLAVSDVARSKLFYQDVLGMEIISDRPNQGPAAFMSFGSQHHDIALFQAPDGAERGELGLVHIAFQVEGDEDELRAMRQRVLDAGYEVENQAFHGITKSVYFRDPDGNRLEIYFDTLEPEEGKRYLSERGGYGNRITEEAPANN